MCYIVLRGNQRLSFVVPTILAFILGSVGVVSHDIISGKYNIPPSVKKSTIIDLYFLNVYVNLEYLYLLLLFFVFLLMFLTAVSFFQYYTRVLVYFNATTTIETLLLAMGLITTLSIFVVTKSFEFWSMYIGLYFLDFVVSMVSYRAIKKCNGACKSVEKSL